MDVSETAGVLFASANSWGPGSVSSGLEACPSSALPKRVNLDSRAQVAAFMLATSFFIACTLLGFRLQGGSTDKASSKLHSCSAALQFESFFGIFALVSVKPVTLAFRG